MPLRAMVIVLIVSAIGVGAMLPWRTRETEAPATVTAPAARGVRIYFPAGHPATLAMPDGGNRAVRSLLNVDRPMHFGDYIWNDQRVPGGRVWVRIDLAAQTISVFRADHEIGTAVILYGADGKPTPTGYFPVLERAEHHRSSLYDAEMPFMLRLTGDGVAIHASDVRQGSATHGCIGVPPEFARRLWAAVRLGDRIAILPATPARSAG